MKTEDIYRTIKAKIDGGKLPVGSILPSETDLSDEFKVARGTIRRAMERLAIEGYVSVTQGRQRVVQKPEPVVLAKLRLHSGHPTPSFGGYLEEVGRDKGWVPRDEVLQSPSEVSCYELPKTHRINPGEIARSLMIKPDEKVTWFVRRRMIADRPLVLQYAFVPLRLVTEVQYEDLRPGGITELYQRHGLYRVAAKAHYRASLAVREEEGLMRLSKGAALIEERRVSFFQSGNGRVPWGAKHLTPYEYLLSLYSDRVSLDFSWTDQSASLGRIPGQPIGTGQKCALNSSGVSDYDFDLLGG